MGYQQPPNDLEFTPKTFKLCPLYKAFLPVLLEPELPLMRKQTPEPAYGCSLFVLGTKDNARAAHGAPGQTRLTSAD
jgi:hypothetical protein